MENDLETWEMAKIFGKWLRCMGHGLSIWETAWLGWKCLKNLTKYLGNDVDLWEIAQICGEMT